MRYKKNCKMAKIKALRGKYYNILSSTEEFILEKRLTSRRIAMQEKKYELSKDDRYIFSILEKNRQTI